MAARGPALRASTPVWSPADDAPVGARWRCRADVSERIRSQRATTRCSYATIAARLDAEGVPTAHGAATWWPATVRAVVNAAA
jgi:hypothetical protein